MRVSQILGRRVAHLGLEGYTYRITKIPRSWVSKITPTETPEERAELANRLANAPPLPHPYKYVQLTSNVVADEVKHHTWRKLYVEELTVDFSKEKTSVDEASEKESSKEPVATLEISVENLRKAVLRADHFMVVYFFECLREDQRAQLSVDELVEILPSYNPQFYLRHATLTSRKELGGIFPTEIKDRRDARAVFFMRFKTFMQHFQSRNADFPSDALRHLFEIAWATGNREYGERLWSKYRTSEKLDIRVIRNYLSLLVRSRASNDLRTYKSKVRDPVSMEAVKKQVQDVLEVLNAKEVPLSTDLVGPLILAHARLGQMREVEDIIEKAWNISIRKILEGRELIPGSMLEIPGPRHSTYGPLHPTPDFIYSLINAYGMNYSIPRLLPILQFFLKPYRQTLHKSAAELLLEYAYKAMWKKVRNNLGTPRDFVEEVYQFILDQKVQPTLNMYDLRFRELMHRQRFGHGRSLIQEYLERFGIFIRLPLEELLKLKEGGKEVFSFQAMRLEDLKYQKERHIAHFRRWLELYCTEGAKRLSRSSLTFSRRDIPNIVQEWGELLGASLHYETLTGFVSLHLRAQEDVQGPQLTRTVARHNRWEGVPEWAYGADKDWYDE
ncbi:hypothetical protein BJ508DRAFT_416349 [Ascobolus immersus RN42]|uniref:ATPase expression protein 2, mitochondrial n=1 Tax=Ascobolus immersus RN42 TaxID=1160509 RepID=A0A3N4I3K2_ASCIM|nr:hypothetical protein BJ508DRAFT_416349 [Ascobolus immersus RN42]